MSSKNTTRKKKSPKSPNKSSLNKSQTIWEDDKALQQEIDKRRKEREKRFMSIVNLENLQKSIEEHQSIIDKHLEVINHEQHIIDDRTEKLNNAISRIRENSPFPAKTIEERFPNEVANELSQIRTSSKSRPIPIPPKTTVRKYSVFGGKNKSRKTKNNKKK